MERAAAGLKIRGTVQGVGFRYFVYNHARRLGVRGWVENRADGSVQAVFEGEKKAVEALIRICEAGPPAAAVTGVEVEPRADEAQYPDFYIKG